MKLFGYIIAACVLLAVVRMVAAALLLALALAVIVGIFTKPRETFGLLLFLLLAGVIQDHAVALIAGLVAVVAFGLIAQSVARK